MFDQRKLSIQIVQAKGDYLWIVKDNQEGLREEIEVLFQPHRKRAGTSAPPNDFRTARTVEKGHGRREKRTITVSSMLADYSTWPELAQVFKLESQRTNALGSHQNGGALWGDEFACRPGRSQTGIGIDQRALGDRKRTALSTGCHAARRSCTSAYGSCTPDARGPQQHGPWAVCSTRAKPMSLRPDANSPIISTEHSLLWWLKGGIRLCNSPAIAPRVCELLLRDKGSRKG